MTFEQWGTFYAMIQAEDLRMMAMQVSVIHPKSPRQTHANLLGAAERTAALIHGRPPKERMTPAQMREFVRGIRGVGVKVMRKSDVKE